MINANTWGVNSSWGIFLDRYMTWDTFRDATKFEYAMIGGLSISQALLISPLTAVLQKRIGTRLTMLLGTAVVFAGLFSASAASRIWHLFLSFAFCFGWGMGLIYIPVSIPDPNTPSTCFSLTDTLMLLSRPCPSFPHGSQPTAA
jgi:MFS family permease